MTRVAPVTVGALTLRNPLLVASGTFGSGLEAAPSVDLSMIGGVVTKSVTSRPRVGNPSPRIFETASGMLNSIGLMNPGVEVFRRDVMPEFRKLPCVKVVNVAGETEEDFTNLARTFAEDDGVDAIELNVSCPNVSHGLDFGVREDLLEPLVTRCRAAVRKPLWVKLTPNVADVASLAAAAERGGADAIVAVNTFVGTAIDWRRREPRLGSANGAGGLSGPAIKPLALWAVRRIAQRVKIPIVGVGGVSTADDVCEFVVAGATAVQVGTRSFVDPGAAVNIAAELAERTRDGSLPPWEELRGTLRVPRAPSSP